MYACQILSDRDRLCFGLCVWLIHAFERFATLPPIMAQLEMILTIVEEKNKETILTRRSHSPVNGAVEG